MTSISQRAQAGIERPTEAPGAGIISGKLCPTCGGPMKHRSDKDHGMFWAMMQTAYDNWPETHKCKPTSRENLYGWILIELSFAQTIDVEAEDIAIAMRTARATFEISKRKIHCMRVFQIEGGVRIAVPDSTAYDAAGKKKFETIRAAVYEYVETVLGVKIEEIKRQTKVGTT